MKIYFPLSIFIIFIKQLILFLNLVNGEVPLVQLLTSNFRVWNMKSKFDPYAQFYSKEIAVNNRIISKT